MKKIKVLEKNQIELARLGIYCHQSIEPSNEFDKFASTIYILVLMAISLVASACYVHENLSINVRLALNAAIMVPATLQWIGTKDESDEYKLYWNYEQKCQSYTTKIGYFYHINILPYAIVLCYALYCMAFGHFDTSSWQLCLNYSAPFSTDTIPGWLLMWTIQLNVCLGYTSCMTTLTSYFIGCCQYIKGMCDHFNLKLRSVQDNVEQNETEKNPRKIEKNRLKITKHLIEAINLHNQIYDIFNMVANISSASIFALLPINTIFMGIAMYELEQSAMNLEAVVLIFDVTCTLCGLFWLIVFCLFATISTDKIANIGDIVYDSQWYDYPVELRKHVILLIARSQTPNYFTGMNLIRCTLEVLGTLLNTSCSYYLIFRKFAQR